MRSRLLAGLLIGALATGCATLPRTASEETGLQALIGSPAYQDYLREKLVLKVEAGKLAAYAQGSPLDREGLKAYYLAHNGARPAAVLVAPRWPSLEAHAGALVVAAGLALVGPMLYGITCLAGPKSLDPAEAGKWAAVSGALGFSLGEAYAAFGTNAGLYESVHLFNQELAKDRGLEGLPADKR